MTARALSVCVAGVLALAPSVIGRSAEFARIAGVVVTTDETPQLVRRAIVALSGGPLALSLNAITDDDGRFEMTDVPAGRFTISASRASYVTIAYGAAAPGRVGVPLVVEAGQRVTGIRLLLARGAAIAGTVRDTDGEPMPGALVGLAKRSGADLVRLPLTAETDDRGGYRLFGLAAGEYFVVARTPAAPVVGQLQAASSDEIDRALQELARGGRDLGVPRVPRPLAAGERAVAMTPVWYPSATSNEDATPISLRTGEERTGADITMRLLPVTTLEGAVSPPAGRDWPANVIVSLYPASVGVVAPALLESPSRANGGRFRYGSVTPSTYFVVAETLSAGMASLMADGLRAQGSVPPRADYLWATDTVVTSGTDITGVALMLAPGLRMHGRIAIESTAGQRRPDVSTARVGIRATWPGRGSAANAKLAADVQFPIAVGPDGSFDLPNLPPATYSFTCTMPSSAPGRGWWLRSATIDGKDILDEPYTLNPSATLPTVVLTLTGRHSSLSGAFQDATGRATSAITVLVFPTNPAWWGETSRRVRVQRPGTDGKYAFVDLPAGDYVLAAVIDMGPDAWRDPAFLRSLVVGGVQVTIGEGEQKTQDLRIDRATISGLGDNGMFSEPAMIALDAGRTFNGGKPPAELSFGYRVVHTASLWKPGERPLLRQQVIEGDPGLSI